MDMTKVIIETFMDMEETNHVVNPKDLEEYNALCVEIGLENLAYGQTADTATLIKKMNLIEKGVYECLFDKKTKLEEFKRVVPTRVLHALLKFKEEQKKINPGKADWEYYIWEMETDIDPVLVARESYSNYYLIARWGEALQDFNTLRKQALEKKKATLDGVINKARNVVTAYEKNPDAMALRYLEGSNMLTIYYD